MARSISIVTASAAAGTEKKGVLEKSLGSVAAEVDFEKVKQNLQKLTNDLGDLLHSTGTEGARTCLLVICYRSWRRWLIYFKKNLRPRSLERRLNPAVG
jgi:hypothetical protein